jgi:hypothetical protein
MARNLWGTGANGHEGKPSWLNADEKERCYATPQGWVLKHPGGAEELLVAVKGLSLASKMGTATIDKVSFQSGTFTRSQARTVKVFFNEPVVVTGNPTLLVTSSAGGTVTATYASINAEGTTLTFNLTTPAVATTLSVGAQSIVLAGGTINEKATPLQGTVAAALAISAGVATAAGTKVIA